MARRLPRPFLAGLIVVMAGVSADGQSHPAIGAVLQTGDVFPFAEWVDGRWREAQVKGTANPWTFVPFGGAPGSHIRIDVGPLREAPKLCGTPALPVTGPEVFSGLERSSDLHASFGLALTGDQQVIGFQRFDQSSPEARLVVGALTPAFNRLEGKTADTTLPIEATRIFRTRTAVDGRHLYRVELTRYYRKEGDGCPNHSRFEGWAAGDRNGQVSLIEGTVETYDCDGKGSVFVTPFGIVTQGGLWFVVSDEHAWEHVDYVIRRFDRDGLPEQLRVLGPCPA